MSVYTWSEIALTVAFCAVVALITVICIRCQRKARKRVEAKRSDDVKLSIRSSANSDDKQQRHREESEVINELSETSGSKETTDVKTNEPIAVKPLTSETDASVRVSKWTDSVISDGIELLPPVCGTVDQFRKSYAYICTNPKVKPTAAGAGAGAAAGGDSLKSDVFFDAASSQSGELGTLARYILDIQKLNDGDRPGTRDSKEIAKSYDASSEDSFTTANESSEETCQDWILKHVSDAPPKKRRVSRRARSLHLGISPAKNMRDKTRKNATWGPGKQIQEGPLCSSSSAGYKSGSDLGAEASSETEHEPSIDYDPVYTNFSGIISEARRQEKYENYQEHTQPYLGTEKEDLSSPFVSSLVLRGGLFVRSGTGSSSDMSPPPRSGSCQDIVMRELDTEVDGAKRKPPVKPARHLSHSISLQGSQVPTRCSLPIHPRACNIPPPKPCSNDVQYVNFKGSLRR